MTLNDLADSMYAAARISDRSQSRVTLARGLDLCLMANPTGDAFTLILQRAEVVPSDQEVLICRRAFHVPADTTVTAEGNSVTLQWKGGETPS